MGIRPPSATRDKVTVPVVLQRESRQARSRTIHNHDISCVTARLDVTPKTTEQNRIVCTSKSEAEVTNNKKTALEVLTQRNDRHEGSRGLFATADLLVNYNTVIQLLQNSKEIQTKLKYPASRI